MAAGGQNRLFDGLFADPEIAALFSAATMLAHFRHYEMALTEAQGAVGRVKDAARIAARISKFEIAPGAISDRVTQDGVPVPAYVAALKAALGADAAAVHLDATSQDLMDTSLALSLRRLSEVLAARLDRVIVALGGLQATQGARTLMGRTRMQAALPIPVATRLEAWQTPLLRARDRFPEARAGVEQLQFGGPVGQLSPQMAAIAERLAKALDLPPPGPVWHSTRDGVVGYGTWLALVTGSLGKMGQDIALMSQQGVDDARLSGGGTSSAMPHKQNPIAAETLVTLARFNAVQIGGLHQAMVHEQERSGAAWALEWMILPQICEATGAALRHAAALLDSIETLGKKPV